MQDIVRRPKVDTIEITGTHLNTSSLGASARTDNPVFAKSFGPMTFPISKPPWQEETFLCFGNE